MKALNRGQYFGYLVLFYAAHTLLNFGFGVESLILGVGLVFTFVHFIASLVITMGRCEDIGISENNAYWVIVPFAWLYFAFKRGRAYELKKQVQEQLHTGDTS